jgi:predicted secreted protein
MSFIQFRDVQAREVLAGNIPELHAVDDFQVSRKELRKEGREEIVRRRLDRFKHYGGNLLVLGFGDLNAALSKLIAQISKGLNAQRLVLHVGREAA